MILSSGKGKPVLALCLVYGMGARAGEITYSVQTVAGSNLVGDGGSALNAQLSDAQCLAVDRQADIAVLDIHEGDWVVYDVLGASLQVHQAVVPFLTVKRGQVFMPDWGPRPWGWEPDRVLPAVAGVGGCC